MVVLLVLTDQVVLILEELQLMVVALEPVLPQLDQHIMEPLVQ